MPSTLSSSLTMTRVLLHNCAFIVLLHSLRRAAFLSLFLCDYLSPLLLAAGLNPSSKRICRATGNALEPAGWSGGASLPSAQWLDPAGRRLRVLGERPRCCFPMEPLAAAGTRRLLLCQEEGKWSVEGCDHGTIIHVSPLESLFLLETTNIHKRH